ncbi:MULTISPECIES: VOC family protein [unclassified Microbacterium]|uniref:VOC family protein n=1 Tax=unclassified Microbacterium TaxID=2609290 RepID=UPI00214C0755|nr:MULTISPECIES: VOC family protein [unclassified Microbacterium]MCR2784537.1 VOC family protein [Microbacterium sp. zg.B96]MDL5350542.1 VOC family protein [Microbacterium sp. zg-YB36]WIM14652.1 VOC family protein [Microbacterium sp. zg-B96]
MKLQTVSIFVDDQQRALDFYTSRLGFHVAHDIPLGEYRWLTVVDPHQPDGTQISLEPKVHPAVGPFTDALVADGIPFCILGVDDVQAEYDRLTALGETFTQPPTAMGPVTIAVLDDTCGNLLQLAQPTGTEARA